MVRLELDSKCFGILSHVLRSPGKEMTISEDVDVTTDRLEALTSSLPYTLRIQRSGCYTFVSLDIEAEANAS